MLKYSIFQVSEVHNRGRDTAVSCPYGNRRAIGVYFINVESAVCWTYPKKSMTLTLDLPSEVEQYLLQEANQQGLSIESVTLQLLQSFICLRQKQAKAVNLLQSWMDDEDIEEQQETGQYLIGALDEDRLSERKLFPVEMKGITW